jgi:hypothetical protein
MRHVEVENNVELKSAVARIGKELSAMNRFHARNRFHFDNNQIACQHLYSVCVLDQTVPVSQGN